MSDIKETYDFKDGKGPVPAHRHAKGGGWVANTAYVADTAYVGVDALVYDNARVFDKAQVYGGAWVYGNAHVSILYSVNRSDGYTFAIYHQKDNKIRITAGCRNFSVKEAKEHWTKTRGGTPLGVESLAIVQYLETMIATTPDILEK